GGGGAKNKSGGKKNQTPTAGVVEAVGSQTGQILASLQIQSESIETLAFSRHHSLLAAGSVDGSIVLFDSAHRFAVRRHVKEAHEGFAVVQVAFGGLRDEKEAWLLTSCGMDGVVRRWDCRGGVAAAAAAGAGGGRPGQQQGLVKEWRGHRGEGEGGGVLGFVLTDGGKVVTAGDDGVSLVFT
ncbi:MAG: hypothetical protein LQ349_009534, partial [Xanthoria aureola]